MKQLFMKQLFKKSKINSIKLFIEIIINVILIIEVKIMIKGKMKH